VALYDRYLATRIRLADAPLPETVAVIITERDLLEDGSYETMADCLGWAFEYGAERVVVYVSVLDAEVVPTIERELETVDSPYPIAVRSPDDDTQAESRVQVSIGLGGNTNLPPQFRESPKKSRPDSSTQRQSQRKISNSVLSFKQPRISLSRPARSDFRIS